MPDRSVSAVVGTLVLCTVDDPGKVVSEIYRILKPSGRYLFLEHVAAMPRTRLRSLQEKLQLVWRRFADGCRLNRESHLVIATAGFAEVNMDCFTLRSQWLPFAPHIFGVPSNRRKNDCDEILPVMVGHGRPGPLFTSI